MTTRPAKGAEWGTPVNLGPLVNSPGNEITPEVSFDGLEIYFESDRPGGPGSDDIWAAKRPMRKDDWGRAQWQGANINTADMEHCPNLTADGLTLFFDLTPAGGTIGDLMVATRPSLDGEWGKPVNLGHSASDHWASSISAGGTVLYFTSNRPGGSGGNDIWQVQILFRSSPSR